MQQAFPSMRNNDVCIFHWKKNLNCICFICLNIIILLNVQLMDVFLSIFPVKIALKVIEGGGSEA